MNRYFPGLAAGLLAALLSGSPMRAQAGENAGPVLFVLDASGSMRSHKPPTPGSPGDTRFEAAKDKIRTLAVTYERTASNLGLLVFGHRSGSCSDIELAVPPTGSGGQRAQISLTLDTVRAKGSTPLAEAIRIAGENISAMPDAANAEIVIVTDGMDTCGGDPAAMAAHLKQKYGITTHVFGLDISPFEMPFVQSIAIAGGGNFNNILTGAGNPLFPPMPGIGGRYFLPRRFRPGAAPAAKARPEPEEEQVGIDPASIPREISFGAPKAPEKPAEKPPAKPSAERAPASPKPHPQPRPQPTEPPAMESPLPLL